MLKTKEVIEKFKSELATNSPVVFAIGKKNEEKGSTPIFIAQQLSTNAYHLPGEISDIQAEMLGLDVTGQFIRGILTLKDTAKQKVKDYFSKEGEKSDIDLQVEHDTVPFYEGQTPIYSSGFWIENGEGKLVFERLTPVRAGEVSHKVYSAYHRSDMRMAPDEMKEYVRDTYFKSIEKVPVL